MKSGHYCTVCERWDETAELDRLRAEVETLRAQLHGMQDGSLVRDLGATCDRYAAECARHRAENAMLIKNGRNEDSRELDRLRTEVAKLKAENEQLRIDKIYCGKPLRPW